MYSKRLLAGWSDMDFNAHMKNTAFLDKAADVRLMFFAENGFPTAEFTRLRIGPVVVRDEINAKTLVETHRIAQLRETFYAITPSRRFPNPLVAELVGRSVNSSQ